MSLVLNRLSSVAKKDRLRKSSNTVLILITYQPASTKLTNKSHSASISNFYAKEASKNTILNNQYCKLNSNKSLSCKFQSLYQNSPSQDLSQSILSRQRTMRDNKTTRRSKHTSISICSHMHRKLCSHLRHNYSPMLLLHPMTKATLWSFSNKQVPLNWANNQSYVQHTSSKKSGNRSTRLLLWRLRSSPVHTAVLTLCSLNRSCRRSHVWTLKQRCILLADK